MEEQCSLADLVPPLPSFLVLIHSQGSGLAKETLSYCSFQLLSPLLFISTWLITVSGQNKCCLPVQTTWSSATVCQTDISQLKSKMSPQKPNQKTTTIEMSICSAVPRVDSWSFSDFTRKLKSIYLKFAYVYIIHLNQWGFQVFY